MRFYPSSTRRGLISAAAALVIAGAGVALAAAPHIKGADPTFTDRGLQLEASGLLAGLGQVDLVVNLFAQANVDATCTNPGNGVHQPPGQNPAPISVTGSQPIPASDITNGNTSFDVFTALPVTPIVGAPDCPNPQWIEDINDLAFTSATITVVQSGVATVVATCTFSPPTTDGLVTGVTCQTKKL